MHLTKETLRILLYKHSELTFSDIVCFIFFLFMVSTVKYLPRVSLIEDVERTLALEVRDFHSTSMETERFSEFKYFS